MNHRLLDPKLATAGTPTFLGVDAGLKLLTDQAYGARQDAKKVLIVLTDGKPTFWPNSQAGKYYGIGYTTKTLNNINYDSFRMANNYYYGGDGTTSPSNAYTSTSGMVTQAYNNLGPGNDIEKYSIAFAFNGTNEVRNMLMNIGTFYDASNALTISTVLEAIRRNILEIIILQLMMGQLVDPLSDYVQIVDRENVTTSALILNDETNQLSVIPSSDVDNYPGYAANIQGGLQENQSGFNFTNMNLGSANGIVRNGFRFNYQVQLKEDYRDGKFYPANGPTYANGRTYENSLGFAIPSIRSETIDIPVEKVWQGDQELPKTFVRILFLNYNKKRYGETNWTAVSGRTISIPKDAEGEALKGEFSKLPTVTITKNNGTFSYRVIDYRIIGKNR